MENKVKRYVKAIRSGAPKYASILKIVPCAKSTCRFKQERTGFRPSVCAACDRNVYRGKKIYGFSRQYRSDHSSSFAGYNVTFLTEEELKLELFAQEVI